MSKKECFYQYKKNNSEPPTIQFGRLLSKIRENGLFLDSCVLSYYLLGCYESKSNRIYRDKEISISIDALNKIISICGKIYTTPEILAEVSTKIKDYAGNTGQEKAWNACRELMINILNEKYIENYHILKNHFLPKFGITDISIILIKELKNNMKPPILLSIDSRFKGLCINEGFCEVIDLKDIEDMINQLPKE